MSEPVYAVELGLVALDTLGIERIDSLRSLTPYTIGISRGFANTEEFDNADYLSKEIASSPKLNLRKLFRNRIDLTVGAFDSLRYQTRLEQLNGDRLVFIQPPLQSHGLYIMASRRIPDGRQVIDDFNTGLASMRADGSLQTILRQYLNRS